MGSSASTMSDRKTTTDTPSSTTTTETVGAGAWLRTPGVDDTLPSGTLDELKSFNSGSLRPTDTVVKPLLVVDSEITPGSTASSSSAGSASAGAGGGTTVSSSKTIADDASSSRIPHGWAYRDSGWAPAPRVVSCDDEARPGYATKKAHEYLETPETLRAKAKALADLILSSKNVLAYCGAGLSTASGIADYASKAKDSVGTGTRASRPKLRSNLDAQPTLGHHVLAVMAKTARPSGDGELLTYLVQQNHDGLPQKAGLPQHKMNEIHGAWYDPSNPVVPMSGSLRDDLFDDLLTWEDQADLTLSLGTSLCGMNADRVVTTVAERSLEGKASGAVIVSLQQTQYDELAALRIFAKIDDVMMLVAEELGILKAVKKNKTRRYRLPPSVVCEEQEGVWRVPYDVRTGLRSDTATMLLDLREGAKLRITGGMYKGDEAEVVDTNGEGHFRLRCYHFPKKGVSTRKVPFLRLFGLWWVEHAVKGNIPILPVVNIGKSRRS